MLCLSYECVCVCLCYIYLQFMQNHLFSCFQLFLLCNPCQARVCLWKFKPHSHTRKQAYTLTHSHTYVACMQINFHLHFSIHVCIDSISSFILQPICAQLFAHSGTKKENLEQSPGGSHMERAPKTQLL